MRWNQFLCRFLLDNTSATEIKNDIKVMKALEKQSHGAERRQGLARMIILYESRLAELEEDLCIQRVN